MSDADMTTPDGIDPSEATSSESRAPEPDVTDPAKLIRLGTMLQAVLAELQQTADTDDAGLNRLAQIHSETVDELSTILSEDLRDELLEFNDCCGSDTPSQSEMRVAHAQLVGWIQGLLRGMQATATAQAQMAQQQMVLMQAQAQQRALMPNQPDQGSLRPQQARPASPNSGYL